VPTYQYACTQCGQSLEVVQSFSDSPLSECPACSGRLRKVFSAVGVVFKGSGFYRTDSRPADPDGKPKSEPAPAAASADKGSSAASSNGSTPSGSNGSGSKAAGSSGSGSGGSGGSGPAGAGSKGAKTPSTAAKSD